MQKKKAIFLKPFVFYRLFGIMATPLNLRVYIFAYSSFIKTLLRRIRKVNKIKKYIKLRNHPRAGTVGVESRLKQQKHRINHDTPS